jgi:hypothetical protein
MCCSPVPGFAAIASFDPRDIDLSRTAGEGPRILKRFLEFAKNGRLEENSPTGLDADSPSEEDVADVIRGYGFLADTQVGSAGFRIDLGIHHPADCEIARNSAT